MKFEMRDVLMPDLQGGPVHHTVSSTSMTLTQITCYMNTGICPSGTLGPTVILVFG